MHFSETLATPPNANTPILQLDAIAISEETPKIFELATPGTALRWRMPSRQRRPTARPAEPVSLSPVARHEKAASWMNEEIKFPRARAAGPQRGNTRLFHR